MAKKIQMVLHNKVTFKDGWERFILDCKARNLRPKTITRYTQSFNIFKRIIPEDTLVEDFGVEIWEEFRLAMAEDPNKGEMTVYTYSRDFKTMIHFFIRQGWTQDFSMPIPKADKKIVETYTDDELEKLLRRPNLRKCTFTEYKCWVICNFLMSTGIRQNSLNNIKISDLDFDSHVVNIRVTKNRKSLIVPLNSDIEKILKEYLQYRDGRLDDYLFCNEYGFQLTKSTGYHAMYWYNKRRGVETTGLHRFRHTFAKKWVLMGGNVVSLSKLLGHSSLDITQNYINLLTTELATDVEEFNIIRMFQKERKNMGK